MASGSSFQENARGAPPDKPGGGAGASEAGGRGPGRVHGRWAARGAPRVSRRRGRPCVMGAASPAARRGGRRAEPHRRASVVPGPFRQYSPAGPGDRAGCKRVSGPRGAAAPALHVQSRGAIQEVGSGGTGGFEGEMGVGAAVGRARRAASRPRRQQPGAAAAASGWRRRESPRNTHVGVVERTSGQRKGARHWVGERGTLGAWPGWCRLDRLLSVRRRRACRALKGAPGPAAGPLCAAVAR